MKEHVNERKKHAEKLIKWQENKESQNKITGYVDFADTLLILKCQVINFLTAVQKKNLAFFKEQYFSLMYDETSKNWSKIWSFPCKVC